MVLLFPHKSTSSQFSKVCVHELSDIFHPMNMNVDSNNRTKTSMKEPPTKMMLTRILDHQATHALWCWCSVCRSTTTLFRQSSKTYHRHRLRLDKSAACNKTHLRTRTGWSKGSESFKLNYVGSNHQPPVSFVRSTRPRSLVTHVDCSGTTRCVFCQLLAQNFTICRGKHAGPPQLEEIARDQS